MSKINNLNEILSNLVEISNKKLFVFEYDKTLLSEKNDISEETLELITQLLSKDKEVAFISNKRIGLIEETIKDSFQKYFEKHPKNAELFKRVLLYTDGGCRKFKFNSSNYNFEEIIQYYQQFSVEDIDKIRNLIDKELISDRTRVNINYKRKDSIVEEFDVYDILIEDKEKILKEARKLDEQGFTAQYILVRAVRNTLSEPKFMINFCETPTIYYLLYGLVDRSYYMEKDFEFKQRLSLISKIRNLFYLEGISAKVELGGSRAIAIRPKNKVDIIKDMENSFEVKSNQIVIAMNAYERAENARAMVYRPDIALINIGEQKVIISDYELYDDSFGKSFGAIAWINLLNLLIDKKIDSKYLVKVLFVMKELLLHPDIRSQKIAEELMISKEELIEIYNFISENYFFHDLLKYNSKYPEYSNSMFKYIKYKERIKKIISGDTAFPLIVEFHLGEECTSNCKMCFSRSVEYNERENNRKHQNLKKGIYLIEELLRDNPDYNLIKKEINNLGKLQKFKLCPFAEEEINEILQLCEKKDIIDYYKFRKKQDVFVKEKSEFNSYVAPMDKKMINNLLNDCKEGGVQEIWFSGGKEPLMSLWTPYAIDYANKLGFVTNLYSNGELLDSQEKREIVMGCSQVRFSVNASNSKTYDLIHFTGNEKYPCLMHERQGQKIFEKVIMNLRELVKLKRETGAKVKLAISQIIQPLNYYDLIGFVDMAYDIGVDSIQIRAESVGMVRTFTKEEKEMIIAQVYEINRRKNLGHYGDMEFDLRGVTKNELNASKDTEQFLPGMKRAELCRGGVFKRGINPYGKVYYCEFSMHPQNARLEPYKSKVMGDLREKSFAKILKDFAGIYPPMCRRCQAHEYAMNITFEKFSEDYKWGIPIGDQPYYKKKDTKNPQLDFKKKSPLNKEEIALIGLGRWGGGAILNTLIKNYPNFIIWGIAKSNYNQWKRKTDLPKNIKIIREEELNEKILTNSNIKIVIITTPSNTHYDLVKQSLLAGKNVFVEKPFTLDFEEAKELVELAKKLNKILVIGHEFMFDPKIKKLKEILESEEIGEIKNVELNMLNPLEGRILDKSTNVISDIGSHMLSILHFLFGKQEVEVLKSKIEGEKANLSFKYNKKKVFINLDRNYEAGKRDRRIIIKGTKLNIILDYEKGEFFVSDSDENKVKEDHKNYPNQLLEIKKSKTTLEGEFESFFNAVENKCTCINDAKSLLWISGIITDTVKLAACYFNDTEEKVFEFYQQQVKKGLNLRENNQITGTLQELAKEEISELPKKNSREYKYLFDKGKKVPFAFGFSAGGLTTRSNEVMSVGFSFVIPELDFNPKSFMEIKFSVAKKALNDLREGTNNPCAKLFVIIMDSYNTHKIVMKILEENDYFGFNKEEIMIYTQGIQKRIIPSEEFLKKYRENKRILLQNEIEKGEIEKSKADEILISLDKGIKLQKGKVGQELKLQDGRIVFNPAGHWDFIRWLILSGNLAKLKRNGVEFLFHSNLNNPAAKLNNVLKGFFINKIERAYKEGFQIPVSLVEVAENRGERGGIIAQVKYSNGIVKKQIIEEPTMKEIENINLKELKLKYPYFNTNNYIIYLPELMKKLNLPDNYDDVMKFEEIAKIVNNFEVPVYISPKEKKDILKDGTKVILVGLQLERYSGAITQLWPWVPLLVNRDDQFIPLKNFEDITLNNINLLAKALKI